MNGIHDMGGMHGFGAIVREENEPVFHEPWEGRAFAILRELAACFPARYPGESRDIIEHIPPLSYLSMSFYERFLEVAVQRAIREGSRGGCRSLARPCGGAARHCSPRSLRALQVRETTI